MADEFIIFTGTANSRLAVNVAREVGVQLGARAVERFPDGEISVRLDEPVRGREVFIVQPTSPPVNEHLVELLAFADACCRASAAHVTAIIPYFGYARSDKRHGRREPIMASMVADLIQAVGVNHVVTIDLHTPQIEGFFRIPVDSLTATETLCRHLSGRLPPGAVVVSPDVGRVEMASAFAHMLGTSVVVLHKRRESGMETEITHLVGDVRGRACLIVDDMISTGGALQRPQHSDSFGAQSGPGNRSHCGRAAQVRDSAAAGTSNGLKRGALMIETEMDVIPRELRRILIPLSGADSDASALHVAADMAPRDAEFFLLHARSGPDDERYPDFKRASEAERFERGIESERIFARANAILASRGLISAGQLVAQGAPAEIILRVANQMAAELIVLTASGPRRVIEHATCSVLVAGPGVAVKLAKV